MKKSWGSKASSETLLGQSTTREIGKKNMAVGLSTVEINLKVTKRNLEEP